MQIPFFLSGVQKVKNALIDSRATDNFITPLLVKRLGLRAQKLQIPKPILTIDVMIHHPNFSFPLYHTEAPLQPQQPQHTTHQ
jgi:hypothetical protein